MLYVAIGVGLAVVALAVAGLVRRSATRDHADHVAPNVLTRINNDYNETRH